MAAVAQAVSNTTSLNTTCVTGIYMLVARGSSELPGLGLMGGVAQKVSQAIPGSAIVPIDYPATFAEYVKSEVSGALAISSAVESYTRLCPKAKIALLGYSQGGQAVMDSLCGNSEVGFVVTPDLADVYDSVVIAAVTFGDPSHIINVPWDRGTSNKTGLFPRKNITACEPFSDQIRGWCDSGDTYCDLGTNRAVHGSYFANYTTDVVDFIVSKFNASTASTSTSTTTTAAPSTSTAPTSTSASTSASTTTTPTGAPSPTSAAVGLTPSLAGFASLVLSVLYMVML
ncbi:putative acetyl xylanesterase [Lasiosphaeria ovina]|uniref:Acetyl xylanesterase n=1 Tax=Lasiosphaeria ovina TaxID=92902 RepID=A0AAE0NFY2_9PEZI|nr:putative acetyl xylanesterase [Lasiosphaeria ovina]